jgi:hypothetical protein
VGEWFTSFDDAWSSFLARTEPLEPFFDEFPEDPSFVAEDWLVVPPPQVKREAVRLQSELEDVPGLVVVPHHFLHVSISDNGPDLDDLRELGPFELRLARVNCFPTAVVAEIESTDLDRVDAPATFLPHLTLACVAKHTAVEPVREAVLPLREVSLGSFVVDELVLVQVPAARTTILQPWTVVERGSLRR